MMLLPMIFPMYFLVAVFFSPPTTGPKPTIQKVGKEHILVLPDRMTNSILAYDSTFTTWKEADYLPTIRKQYTFTSKQALFAVIGDFNGDRRTDLIVQGHDRRSDVVLAVLSADSGYSVVELQRTNSPSDPRSEKYGMGSTDEYGLSMYLRIVRPGRFESQFESDTVDLKSDAVEIVFFEKASVVYYYANGKFNEYATGD